MHIYVYILSRYVPNIIWLNVVICYAFFLCCKIIQIYLYYNYTHLLLNKAKNSKIVLRWCQSIYVGTSPFDPK